MRPAADASLGCTDRLFRYLEQNNIDPFLAFQLVLGFVMDHVMTVLGPVLIMLGEGKLALCSCCLVIESSLRDTHNMPYSNTLS